MEIFVMTVILIVLLGYALYLIFTDGKIPFRNLGNLQNRRMYPVQKQNHEKPQNELSNAYYVTSVLTKSEYAFYTILEDKCDYADLIICPKVRLEDFINVRNIREKQSYRGRIKSRHVDFLICDRQMNPLCGIELDDSSHNSWKAQKADNFKNELYRAIGLTLYRVQTGSNFEAKIDFIIHELQQKSTP